MDITQIGVVVAIFAGVLTILYHLKNFDKEYAILSLVRLKIDSFKATLLDIFKEYDKTRTYREMSFIMHGNWTVKCIYIKPPWWWNLKKISVLLLILVLLSYTLPVYPYNLACLFISGFICIFLWKALQQQQIQLKNAAYTEKGTPLTKNMSGQLIYPKDEPEVAFGRWSWI